MFTELRKRHVLEIALVYLGVAWLFIEITQFVVGTYGISRKALDAVFLVAALGFPAFIVIAWYHGERGPQRVRRGEISLLLTLGVLGAIGTYRIAIGEELSVDPAAVGDRVTSPANSDATLASADGAEADLGRNSLAVLPFKNNVADSELAWLGPGLADLLTTNFAQIEPLRVVGRQTLYDLLIEEGRTESEEIPEALASTLARAAGARMMLWGTVSGTHDDLVIDAQLIELENGTLITAERVRGSDVFTMVDTLTARLTRTVAGERRGPPPMTLSRFGTRDMEALAAFQRGVASERAGKPDEARGFYVRAAEIDTTFMLPVIRLAGDGRRKTRPSAVSVGVGEIDEVEFLDVDGLDSEADIDWAAMDEDERQVVRARLRDAREHSAESHKQRALNLLEKMGREGWGEALITQMEGMSGEEFILKFDSTLSETMARVTVITTSALPDSSGR